MGQGMYRFRLCQNQPIPCCSVKLHSLCISFPLCGQSEDGMGWCLPRAHLGTAVCQKAPVGIVVKLPFPEEAQTASAGLMRHCSPLEQLPASQGCPCSTPWQWQGGLGTRLGSVSSPAQQEPTAHKPLVLKIWSNSGCPLIKELNQQEKS